MDLNANESFEPCTMLRQLLGVLSPMVSTNAKADIKGHLACLAVIPSLIPLFLEPRCPYCPIVQPAPARTPTSYDAALQLSFHSPVDHMPMLGIYRHNSRASYRGGQLPLSILGVHRPSCVRNRHSRVGGREAAGVLPVCVNGTDNVVA